MENTESVDITQEISSLMNEHTEGEIDNNEYVEGKNLVHYKILQLLGTGSSSNVVLGVNTLNNEHVAIKIIKRKDSTTFTKTDHRVFREVLMVSLINHPYVVTVKDFLFNDFYYFIIFEYVKGKQLYDVIVNGYLNENDARRYFRQILSAVDFLHKNNIVHRDLKIENILLDECDNIKIIDFGLSNFFDNKMLLNTFCGSLYFAAPELLAGQKYIGPEIDIWSLGIVLYVLLNGTVPFDDKDVVKLQEKIQDGNFSYLVNSSNESKFIIEKMLHKDVLHRCTLTEVIESEWANMGYDIPINNYFTPRYTYKIDQSKLRELSQVIKFQFRNIEKEILRYYVLCTTKDSSMDINYWSKRPVISIYNMLLEHYGDLEIENTNKDIYESIMDLEERDLTNEISYSDKNINYLKNLHNFVVSLDQKERQNPCGRFYKVNVFSPSSKQEQKINTNPKIKNTYIKGIFQGIRIKNIGSHNALKKILLDIFNQNKLKVKTSEKYFICSFPNQSSVTFKVSLYYNVILGEYYVNLKHVSGERQEFRKFYNTVYSNIQALKIL